MATLPSVLHVVESWRPVATGYTSRGWHIVEHQARGGVARPRVLVTSRQSVHGGDRALAPPGVEALAAEPSATERRWRRVRRWHLDRGALEAAIVQAARDVDLIHVHWASGIGAAAADAAERLGLPLVAEVRFDLAGAFTSETLALPAPFERALRQRFEAHLPRAARVVAASHSLKRLLIRDFPRLAHRVDVVPNGIEPGASRGTKVLETDKVTLGTTANMLRYEGLERLIDAARGIEGVRLLFVGDGPCRSALEQRAWEAGVEAVFVGRVSPNEVSAQLARMDVFVVPRHDVTITRFASPIKVVEAMAAGLPVVASDVGDLGDLLADGRGVAVPPGDAAALRAALGALTGDGTRRHAIGARAAAWAGEMLPWPRVVAGYSLVYAAALGRPAPAANTGARAVA